MPGSVLILGCGFTGGRVAERMLKRGYRVVAAARDPGRLTLPAEAGRIRVDTADPRSLAALGQAPPDCLVLHSVPLVESADGEPADPTPQLMAALGDRPSRVVYLSSTAVYGGQAEVDETTPPAPRTRREHLRLQAEQAVQAGRWSSMVLRPAAIYGPGRGIQVSLPRGDFRLLGDGSNWVSRIHVEDLAELACTALLSSAEGAWPAADLEPARSCEVAEFVSRLLGCPMPESSPPGLLHETRRANRRVDARGLYRLLGLEPRYPSYREGIPASIVL